MAEIRLTVQDRTGRAFEVQAAVGLSLMEVLRDGGYEDVFALCGGACACATCHVHITGLSDAIAVLPPLGEDENDLLDGADDRQTTSRLSCQIPVTEGLNGAVVVIAPES